MRWAPGAPLSAADRRRWEARYRQGAYAERTRASAWLARWAAAATPGRALDVACGSGRNALHLAALGFDVVGVDIAPTALRQAAAAATARGLAATWLEQDLDAGIEVTGDFDFIAMIRFVDAPLLRQLATRLAPGGVLVVEEHLRTERDVGGPRGPAFRVAPGALLKAAAGLTVLGHWEGVTADPDGRAMALARLAARRP